MKRQPIASSSLQSIGYDHAAKTLEIEFKNGSVWQYHGVPPSEHQALVIGGGKYFHSNIKGHFSESKV